MNVVFIICLVLYMIHIMIISTKSLHMLQQNRYNRGYRYIKWILKNFKENFINLNLLYFVFVLTMFNESLNDYSPYIFMVIVLFLTYASFTETASSLSPHIIKVGHCIFLAFSVISVFTCLTKISLILGVAFL